MSATRFHIDRPRGIGYGIKRFTPSRLWGSKTAWSFRLRFTRRVSIAGSFFFDRSDYGPIL